MNGLKRTVPLRTWQKDHATPGWQCLQLPFLFSSSAQLPTDPTKITPSCDFTLQTKSSQLRETDTNTDSGLMKEGRYWKDHSMVGKSVCSLENQAQYTCTYEGRPGIPELQEWSEQNSAPSPTTSGFPPAVLEVEGWSMHLAEPGSQACPEQLVMVRRNICLYRGKYLLPWMLSFHKLFNKPTLPAAQKPSSLTYHRCQMRMCSSFSGTVIVFNFCPRIIISEISFTLKNA